MALLTFVGSAGAREFWLAHEFRQFCAYPRIQKGYHYYKKGNYEKAAELFHGAVKVEPNNIEARKALAETCLTLKVLSCAKNQGNALNRLAPASPEGNFVLARTAHLAKKPGEAVHAAEAALEQSGLTAEQRKQVIDILLANLLKTQSLEQAQAELLKLTRTQVDPERLKAAYDKLIDLYFIRNETTEGIKLYDEYRKRFGPADTPTRMYWSNLLDEHGNAKGAYDMIASLPSSGGVLAHQANLLEKLGRFREAADRLLEKGDSQEKTTSRYWMRVATLYNKAGCTDREFTALAKGIRRVKDNTSLYHMAIDRLIHVKAYHQAAQRLKAEISEHGDDAARMKLAEIYEKENRYADACRSLYPLWQHFKGTREAELKLTRQLLYLLEKEEDWPLYLKVMQTESRTLEAPGGEKPDLPIPMELFTDHHLHRKLEALETAYPFPDLPEDERFALILGLIHLERQAHREDRAKGMVRGLAQWKSLNVLQLEQVASLAYDFGMCSEATALAKELMSRSPESVHARLIAGYCFQKLGKPRRAAAYLEQAARLKPDIATPAFLTGLGALYADIGNKQEALSHWQSALEQKFDPDLALKMTRLYREAHDDKAAARLLSRIDPDDLTRRKRADFWAIKGDMAERAGDLKAAARDYQASLAVWETAHIWGQLGYNYIRQGEKALAIQAFEQALTLDPEKGAYRASLAYLLAETGKPAAAAAAFRQAIQAEPDNITLYEGLGYAEIGARDYPAATEAFKHVIDYYETRPDRTSDPEIAKKLYGMRQTLDNINRQWHVNFAEVMRLDNSRFGPQPNIIANTSYSGFGILSGDYRVVQDLGPLNTDMSVYGRLIWANKNRSLSVEKDLTQAGLGLCVKPLGDYNLLLSMERMFQVGSDTQNDWMARASASFSRGGEWRPVETAWGYYDLYLDAAYLIDSGQHYLTSNMNWGRAYKVRDAWAVVPYLTGGAVDSNGNTWIDAGAGVTLAIWGLQGRYHAHRLLTRITLEGRQQLAGNSKDEHTVRLKYEMRF